MIDGNNDTYKTYSRIQRIFYHEDTSLKVRDFLYKTKMLNCCSLDVRRKGLRCCFNYEFMFLIVNDRFPHRVVVYTLATRLVEWVVVYIRRPTGDEISSGKS